MQSNRILTEVVLSHQAIIRSKTDETEALFTPNVRDCCVVTGGIMGEMAFMSHFTILELNNIEDARRNVKILLNAIEKKLMDSIKQSNEDNLSDANMKVLVLEKMNSLIFNVVSEILEEDQVMGKFKKHFRTWEMTFNSNNFSNLKQALIENGIREENIVVNQNKIESIRKQEKDVDVTLSLNSNNLYLTPSKEFFSDVFTIGSQTYQFSMHQYFARLDGSNQISRLHDSQNMLEQKIDSKKRRLLSNALNTQPINVDLQFV
jgi:hypothetical protein